MGGPIGLVENGGPIAVDVAARRRAAWKAPEPHYARGALAKYAALVGGADQGAVCG